MLRKQTSKASFKTFTEAGFVPLSFNTIDIITPDQVKETMGKFFNKPFCDFWVYAMGNLINSYLA